MVVFSHDDPRERCNISSGLLSNMWYRVLPETADRYGWKETHGTAISASAGEVVYLCGDVKSRTQLVGEIGETVCMWLCV